MSFEELQKLFELQRENVKKEKGKLITIPVEQLDQMEKEYIEIQKELRDYKEELKKTKQKLEETRSKSKSWQSKYTWQIQKSKEQIRKELSEKLEPQVRKDLEWRLGYKEAELEAKYHQKMIDLNVEYLKKKEKVNDEIEEVVKERIEKLGKIKEDFANRLSEEKNRYEEKHDLDNERNQGYLIGIAKTRKELIKAFEEYEKKVIKKL